MTVPAHEELVTPVPDIVRDGVLYTQDKQEEVFQDFEIIVGKVNKVIAEISTLADINPTIGDLVNQVDSWEPITKPTKPPIDTNFPKPKDLIEQDLNFPPKGQFLELDPTFDAEAPNKTITTNFQNEPGTIEVNAVIPNKPATVPIGTVSNFILDEVPTFDDEKPIIKPITGPDKFTKPAPTVPTTPRHAMPDKPGADLPEKVGLRTITLPTEPALFIPTFDGVLPAPLDNPPDVNFNWAEDQYISALADVLKAKLTDLVQNIRQTGLNPTIEQQIWDRGRERTTAVTRDNIIQIQRNFEQMGWELLQGDEAQRVFEAIENQTKQDISESRSIAIGQADLEQKNFQFAISQSIAYEGQLMNLHNAVQQRAFEAARYAIEALISLFNAKVAYFNANVVLYQAVAQVYETRLRGELAKLEIFKAQLEGQKLIGDLNRQDIDNYRAQLDAVIALFELYKTELEGVKVELEQDRLVLLHAETEIKAFTSEISAKELEYRGYEADLSGEKIKADIHSVFANVFGKRVDAYSTATNAKVSKLNSDIKLNIETPLQIRAQNIELFKTEMEAEKLRTGILNSINELRIRIFEAVNKSESDRVTAETDIYKTDSEVFKNKNEAKAAELEAINKSNQTTATIYETDVTAKSKQIDAINNVNQSNTEVYKSQVQAKTAEIEGKVAIYDADAKVFDVETRGQAAKIDAQIKVQGQELEVLLKRAEIDIEAYKANTGKFISQKELIISTLRTLAQVHAQLTAAFGSAISYGASITSATNWSHESSIRHSESTSS